MANYGVGSINQYRKKLTHTHEFISTAYHEAGHTIYGLLHFMKVISVIVYENKQTKRIDGFTHYETAFHDQIKDPSLIANILKTEICISYAGLSAEKVLFRSISGSDKFPMFLKDGSSYDTLSASELINKFNLAPPGRKRYAFKQKMIKETFNELETHWDAVTQVSYALFQKKKLYYSDLKKILTQKGKNKKFWKNQFKKIDFVFNNLVSLDEKELKSVVL